MRGQLLIAADPLDQHQPVASAQCPLLLWNHQSPEATLVSVQEAADAETPTAGGADMEVLHPDRDGAAGEAQLNISSTSRPCPTQRQSQHALLSAVGLRCPDVASPHGTQTQ